MPHVSLSASVSPSIEVEVSLRVIAGAVIEWCKVAGVDDSDYWRIGQGILEGQAIDSLFLVYAAPGKRKVGELIFHFDWKLHTVSVAKAISKLATTLTPVQPITNQIMTEFTSMVDEFREEVMVRRGGTSLQVYYLLREEIRDNEGDYREWLEKLKLSDDSDYDQYVGDVDAAYLVFNGELHGVVSAEFRE